ncbi:hypothetical protein B0H17DRAFT_1127007 [Mycena rosella]|uniref:Uncharacterized protein n=1 Tax=Mycena rosella TaxID=1033263 RepID=A0AAD7GRZ7_MYCRO|nr:hypothetical protein B0H17DRAFT_1127007 [Mycena rosella]
MSHKDVSNTHHYQDHTREQDGWTVLAPPPAAGDDLPPPYALGGAEGITRQMHSQTRSVQLTQHIFTGTCPVLNTVTEGTLVFNSVFHTLVHHKFTTSSPPKIKDTLKLPPVSFNEYNIFFHCMHAIY